jgi:hypothetical protein
MLPTQKLGPADLTPYPYSFPALSITIVMRADSGIPHISDIHDQRLRREAGRLGLVA